MSVEERVKKLSALLARIEGNRRPFESVGSAALAAPAPPLRPEPIRLEPAPEAPPSAVISERPAPASRFSPTPGPMPSQRSATPMEQALSFELEVEEPPQSDIDITFEEEDDGPIVTIEPGPMPDAIDDDLDGVPTAPIGTRAAPRTPERIERPPARAAAPVVKVVSRPAPRTFGELLDRTLSLRPS